MLIYVFLKVKLVIEEETETLINELNPYLVDDFRYFNKKYHKLGDLFSNTHSLCSQTWYLSNEI